MYLEYWGFRTFPFENVPNQSFLYLSRTHEEALSRMVYTAEMRKGGALLTGEIGCGKTMLTEALLDRLPREHYDIGLITNPSLQPEELLEEICGQFGIPLESGKKIDLLRALRGKVQKNLDEARETLLIIDEAQLLSYPAFEEIRLLLNFHSKERFLLTIILVGQPELRMKIKGVEQLHQRLPVTYHLTPFDFKETALYIIFRQQKAGRERNVFSKQAIERIYRYAKGVPRMINNLCDLALLVGHGNKAKLIASEIVETIIRDGEIYGPNEKK